VAQRMTQRGNDNASLALMVFGVLRQQRQMREFRMRSVDKGAIEFALAATAYNLTRSHRRR